MWWLKKGDKMKILLISGHGAGDSGACATIKGVKYKEATETITMVKLIEKELKKYADVDLYPTDRNAFQDIKNGCLKVNFKKYDYVLEIHFNACVNDLKGNGKTTGTEIYVPKSESVTDTEKAIVNAIAKFGLKNRGVQKYNWTVTTRAHNAGVQSSLVEICFIDDADDMKIYNAKKEEIAQAIADAIISTNNLKADKPKSKTNNTFKVKCLDNLNVRKFPNGDIVIKNGALKGTVYTIVDVSGTWGKLKSGAGWISISPKYVKRV